MSSNIEVLLVEDSFSDAQMVEAIVSSSDLDKPKLHHADRFKSALSMLQQKAYDLVLLDLHLPDGEGLGLIKQLKQQVPETPVVVLTGSQDDKLAVEALKEGAQDYVLKSDTFSPARLSQKGHTDLGNWLVRRIQYAIKRAELARQLAKQQQIDNTRYILANRANHEGIWDWDIESNSLYLSPCWKSLLGINGLADETYIHDGLTQWLSLIHPQDRARFDRTLQNYLDHQQPQFYCEYRIKRADGEYIWAMAKGEALWNSAGVAYRIAGSQTDITSRKQKEAAAYDQRELVPTTLHAVAAGLLSIQANLLVQDGHYEEAEPLLSSALELRKSLLGPTHPEVGVSLYNLATVYDNQFRFIEAESLFKAALSVFEQAFGANNPHTRKVRNKVDMICRLNQVMKLTKADHSNQHL